MPTTHSETIVVVDDDQSIRTYLSEVLTPRGYQCQTFEDSLSALRWLSAAQSQPDAATPGLVLSDIALPGMSGMDLIPLHQVGTTATTTTNKHRQRLLKLHLPRTVRTF